MVMEKKMQCPSCKSKWDLDPSVSQLKINKCPFCGANLEPEENPDTTTIEGVLRFIVLEYGEKIYENSNSQRFKALLCDLATEFPKERKCLNIAIDNQIPERLLKKNGSDDDEKRHAAMESNYMLVELGIQPVVAQQMVTFLCMGLGWKIFVDSIRNDDNGDSVLQRQYDELFKRFTDLSNKLSAEPNHAHRVRVDEKNNKKTHTMRIGDFILVSGGMSRQGTNKVLVGDFWICDHPVTQKEYLDVTGKAPAHFKGDNRPVECVSWYDAIEYCNALSKKENLSFCYFMSAGEWKCDFTKNGYRLLTEAEWEYAAKGGEKSYRYEYSGSHDIDEVAWYDKNSAGQTHDVKLKTPNELGIYDMSGNVWEWVWDYNDELERIQRGGGWVNNNSSCRILYGRSHIPGYSYYALGFRVARSCIN